MSSQPSWTADIALSVLLDTLDEGTAIFDESLRCRGLGRRAASLLGVEPSSAIGLRRSELFSRAALASPEADNLLASIRSDSLGAERFLIDPVEVRTEAARTIVWTSVPIERDGAVVGRIDVMRDVTREREVERSRAEMARKLDEVTMVDALTGLANRRRFEEECEKEHRRAQRAWDSYAVAWIDVDGMSNLNTEHGTPVGDELLRRIAESLNSTRRHYDVVARWAGDDFVLLLPGVDSAGARSALGRAITSINAAMQELRMSATVSGGAAVWIPPSAETAADIVSRAQAALGAARSRGPGSIRIDAGVAQWKKDDLVNE